ncbi:unnamed protein product [Ambrosiozyma monospora]|uniref:Unnamed protein product n=1 Tax=Ambrosiozyma monospora TaxID=43982 RepID=A0ACB5TQG2_AMBMO|nr:unnamed protein product [Ambrosiozyma monospora]
MKLSYALSLAIVCQVSFAQEDAQKVLVPRSVKDGSSTRAKGTKTVRHKAKPSFTVYDSIYAKEHKNYRPGNHEPGSQNLQLSDANQHKDYTYDETSSPTTTLDFGDASPQSDNFLQPYLDMDSETFGAYLAKGSSCHFTDFLCHLRDKIKKHKHKDCGECDGGDTEEEDDDSEDTEEDTTDDNSCVFFKFKELLDECSDDIDDSKAEGDKQPIRVINVYASHDFNNETYCRDEENQEECAKELRVMSLDNNITKLNWLEENVKRRISLLKEVMESPEKIDDDIIVKSEEFHYRDHNIFLDQDDNEFVNAGNAVQFAPMNILLGLGVGYAFYDLF